LRKEQKLIGVRFYLIFAFSVALALGAVAERSFSTNAPTIAFQF